MPRCSYASGAPACNMHRCCLSVPTLMHNLRKHCRRTLFVAPVHNVGGHPSSRLCSVHCAGARSRTSAVAPQSFRPRSAVSHPSFRLRAALARIFCFVNVLCKRSFSLWRWGTLSVSSVHSAQRLRTFFVASVSDAHCLCAFFVVSGLSAQPWCAYHSFFHRARCSTGVHSLCHQHYSTPCTAPVHMLRFATNNARQHEIKDHSCSYGHRIKKGNSFGKIVVLRIFSIFVCKITIQ